MFSNLVMRGRTFLNSHLCLVLLLSVSCAKQQTDFSQSTSKGRVKFKSDAIFADKEEIGERYEEEIQQVLETDVTDFFASIRDIAKIGDNVVEIDGVTYENIDQSLEFTSEYLLDEDVFGEQTYGEYLESFDIDISRLATMDSAQELLEELKEEVDLDTDHIVLASSEAELVEIYGAAAEEESSPSLSLAGCWKHVQKAGPDGKCTFVSPQDFQAGSQSGEAKRMNDIRNLHMKNGGAAAAESAVGLAGYQGQKWHAETAAKAAAHFLGQGNKDEAAKWQALSVSYAEKASGMAQGLQAISAVNAHSSASFYNYAVGAQDLINNYQDPNAANAY